jgi:hypothetical protein
VSGPFFQQFISVLRSGQINERECGSGTITEFNLYHEDQRIGCGRSGIDQGYLRKDFEQNIWNFQGRMNVEIISSPYRTPPRTCIYLPTLHIPTSVPADSAARNTRPHHHQHHLRASLNSPMGMKARGCVLPRRYPRSQVPCPSASRSREMYWFRGTACFANLPSRGDDVFLETG